MHGHLGKGVRSKKRIPEIGIEKYSFAALLAGNISHTLFHSGYDSGIERAWNLPVHRGRYGIRGLLQFIGSQKRNKYAAIGINSELIAAAHRLTGNGTLAILERRRLIKEDF